MRVLPEAEPPPGGPPLVDLVSVTGGGALGVSKSRVPVLVRLVSRRRWGFADFDAWLSNADGTTDTQAGSHPYSLTVAFALTAGVLVVVKKRRRSGSRMR